MSASGGSLFAGRPRTGSKKLGTQLDADGNEIEVIVGLFAIPDIKF